MSLSDWSRQGMWGLRLAAVRLAILAGLLGLWPLAPVAAAPAHNLLDAQSVEGFIDGVMAAHLASYHIPGAAVTVVSNGEVLLGKGYGYADVEQYTAVDPSRTLFRPASVTKLFTWTAVMQLVEQERLDLHTDVNAYLDFTVPATFSEPITLAHLMTHTPGFEDVNDDLFVFSAAEMRMLRDYLVTHMPARVYAPGQVGAYSNYGTALAGYIVERTAGQPFADYVEAHIFAPLGMTRSTLRQPLPPTLYDDLAPGYAYHNGDYLRGDFEYMAGYPAGGMSLSPADMAPFMLAHLNEGRYGEQTILQPETVAQMHSRRYTPDPRLHGMAYGFWEQQINGRRVLHHSGDTFLYSAILLLIPEEQVGLFAVYNSLGGVTARTEIAQAFMDHFYPADPPPRLAPHPETGTRLAPYIGEYHMARIDFSGIEKVVSLLGAVQIDASPAGELRLALPGDIQPYVEVEPGLFRHQRDEDYLVLRTDAEGQAWLHLDGLAPFALFKAPWYATSTVTALTLGVGLLLLVGSSLAWLASALQRRRGDAPRSRATRWTRASQIAAGVFSALLIGFAVAFAGLLSDVDPTYGVPRVFFGPTPLLEVVLFLPWLLAAAALGMIISMALVWAQAGRSVHWGLWQRLHYTVLTLSAAAVMAVLAYWNLWTV